MSQHSRILITGGLGFIGSHLATKLARGHSVTLVDKRSRSDSPLTPPKNAQVITLDLRSRQFADLLTSSRFDCIFHLAGTAHPSHSLEHPRADFSNSLLATFKLLETLRRQKTKPKLVFASSVAIYGACTDSPLSVATSLPQPLSPYAVSKLSLEHYLRTYALLYQLPTLSLRLFSTYGPGLKKQVVYDLIHKLHQDSNHLEIIGDGSQTRDLSYISDHVANIISISQRSRFRGEVINIGQGKGTSVIDLATKLISLLKLSPKIVYSQTNRPFDGQSWIADIRPGQKLGLKISTTLNQGLLETINWYSRAHT